MPALKARRLQLSVDTAWNGAGTVLQINQAVTMPQTANGTMILGWINQSAQNNAGKLSLTSGASVPMELDAPALARQPSVLTNNFQANNLTLTNVSLNDKTPIFVSAYGPGVPGQTPLSLAVGVPRTLVTGQSAAGPTQPRFMQLVMSANSGSFALFGVIGGPLDSSGNNGYVFTVNDSVNGDTGPDTGKNPPPGYYATTSGNSYPFSFNFVGGSIYVVNLSPVATTSVQVLLRAL
jgi:hypothetical protein